MANWTQAQASSSKDIRIAVIKCRIAIIKWRRNQCAALVDEAATSLGDLQNSCGVRGFDYARESMESLQSALKSTKIFLAALGSRLAQEEIANNLSQHRPDILYDLELGLELIQRVLKSVENLAIYFESQKPRRWIYGLGNATVARDEFNRLGNTLWRTLRVLIEALTLMGVVRDTAGDEHDSNSVVDLPGFISPETSDAASLQSQDRSLGAVPIGSKATSMVYSIQSRTTSMAASIQSQDRSLGAVPIGSRAASTVYSIQSRATSMAASIQSQDRTLGARPVPF